MLPLVSQSWFYAIVLYVVLVICYLPEWLGSFKQHSERGAVKRDRGSYAFLMVAIFVGIVAAFFIVNIRPPVATIEWNQQVVFWVGIVLMLAGAAFRWYAIRVLGKYFTRDVATRADQQVVARGPYKWIRHPSYSGALLTLLGFGLATTNWLALIVVMACGLLGYGYRVRVEERALRQDLGESYRSYMQRTRRFIPFVW